MTTNEKWCIGLGFALLAIFQVASCHMCMSKADEAHAAGVGAAAKAMEANIKTLEYISNK